MWADWLTTVVNARGAGLLYSALEAPMLALPLVAWLGRRRELTRPSGRRYAILEGMIPVLPEASLDDDVLVLLVSLVVILFAAELFTNGIEWMGRKLGLGEGAVGSVLAAVGTALPETLIPIIAIVFATAEGAHEVGVGAILGAPFMLSTLAMFVTGVGVFAFRARRATGHDVSRRHRRPGARPALLLHRLRAGRRGGLPAGRTCRSGAGSCRHRAHRAVRLVRQGPPRRARPASTPRTSPRCGCIRSTAGAHRLDPSDPRLRVIAAPGASPRSG